MVAKSESAASVEEEKVEAEAAEKAEAEAEAQKAEAEEKAEEEEKAAAEAEAAGQCRCNPIGKHFRESSWLCLHSLASSSTSIRLDLHARSTQSTQIHQRRDRSNLRQHLGQP